MSEVKGAITEDINLDDLELDGVEDAVVTELNAKAKEAAKVKEGKAPKSTLSSIQPLAEGEVGVAYIAEVTGKDQRVIRAYLRRNLRNMDESKGQRYRWQKDSKDLQAIIDGLTAMATKAPKVDAAATKATIAKGAVETAPATPVVEEIDIDTEIEEI